VGSTSKWKPPCSTLNCRCYETRHCGAGLECFRPGGCGDCYGAEGQCCNTCSEVELAYNKMGWVLLNPAEIPQCVREGKTTIWSLSPMRPGEKFDKLCLPKSSKPNTAASAIPDNGTSIGAPKLKPATGATSNSTPTITPNPSTLPTLTAAPKTPNAADTAQIISSNGSLPAYWVEIKCDKLANDSCPHECGCENGICNGLHCPCRPNTNTCTPGKYVCGANEYCVPPGVVITPLPPKFPAASSFPGTGAPPLANEKDPLCTHLHCKCRPGTCDSFSYKCGKNHICIPLDVPITPNTTKYPAVSPFPGTNSNNSYGSNDMNNNTITTTKMTGISRRLATVLIAVGVLAIFAETSF